MAPIYGAHCAVIFATAQLSCYFGDNFGNETDTAFHFFLALFIRHSTHSYRFHAEKNNILWYCDIWLAGGWNLKIEVVEGDFNDLLWSGDERIEDTVDVSWVDLRMIRWCEDALLTLIPTVLITHVTAAAAAAAGCSTSAAIHDAVTRYTRTSASSSLHYLIIHT